MDTIDIKIIRLLEQNARMPLNQLAAQVQLSSPATAARMEKLERDGLIAGYGVKLNHQALGYPIMAYINLAMHPSQKARFYPFIEKHPNVLECACVTGHYSMLMKVAFESTEMLDAFIGRLQQFGNTETQIVFSVAKERTNVHVADIAAGNYPQLPQQEEE